MQPYGVEVVDAKNGVVSVVFQSGNRRLLLSVPVYYSGDDAGRKFVVSGRPALLPAPTAADLPQVATPEGDDAAEAELKPQLEGFFKDYASGDTQGLQRYLAAGTSLPNLGGALNFAELKSVVVPVGVPSERSMPWWSGSCRPVRLRRPNLRRATPARAADGWSRPTASLSRSRATSGSSRTSSAPVGPLDRRTTPLLLIGTPGRTRSDLEDRSAQPDRAGHTDPRAHRRRHRRAGQLPAGVLRALFLVVVSVVALFFLFTREITRFVQFLILAVAIGVIFYVPNIIEVTAKAIAGALGIK